MDIRRVYGLCTDTFVVPKTNTESLVFGGMAEDSLRWTRILSSYAARSLWFHLTRLLFPTQAEKVTANMRTFQTRSHMLPTITDRVSLDKLDNGHYEITGWAGDQAWTARLTANEAQRLWNALDVTLHPKGWLATAVGEE